jgi:hypothetical protein
MSPSQKAVSALANQGRRIETPELVRQLAAGGFVSQKGTPYKVGRGVHRPIATTWQQLDTEGDIQSRDNIAWNIFKPDGTHAWPCDCARDAQGKCLS